jgi:hypothetical protein
VKEEIDLRTRKRLVSSPSDIVNQVGTKVSLIATDACFTASTFCTDFLPIIAVVSSTYSLL